MPSNEYMREYMNARYHRRKREYQKKLGGKCREVSEREVT